MTSQILGHLTQEVASVRHTVLKNRAAIDFLLLARGHGCEDFEGMCCLNFSDHSKSINKKLTQIKDNLHKLKEIDDPLGD